MNERRGSGQAVAPPDWHDGVLAMHYLKDHPEATVAVDYYAAIERKRWAGMSIRNFIRERRKYREWVKWHERMG